jgi:FADH2 O2-dependent halogenase
VATYDFLVLGGGFGGSLTAAILARSGRRVLLVDRLAHPRFAIGESTTPIANLVLSHLAEQYSFPQLAPLAEFGSWQRERPELACGLKRGFTYFQHLAGVDFLPDPDHRNELAVEASRSPEDADTHWYRPDFDTFLVRVARDAGVEYREHTIAEVINPEPSWHVRLSRDGGVQTVQARFLIDATGEAMMLSRRFGVSIEPTSLQTHSRAVFGHFRNVGLWNDLYRQRGGRVADHLFHCDDAALHHCFEGGWMYVLRFNNGVTSAGFSLDPRKYPLNPAETPTEEWHRWLRTLPAVGEQFAHVELTAECGPIRRTNRLQRRAAQLVGPGWALLPFSAYGLDALHSTGNAHTLIGIERLVAALLADSSTRDQRLSDYAAAVSREIDAIDAVVSGSYSAFGCFRAFVTYSSLYFAAATVSEARRRATGGPVPSGFLLAGEPDFMSRLTTLRASLDRLLFSSAKDDPASLDEFESQTRELIAPYNMAGLLDPERKNLYPFTG